ncbi:MAG: hypothetical protein P8166_01385 [Candidatus Thiodiazotropha sp.]
MLRRNQRQIPLLTLFILLIPAQSIAAQNLNTLVPNSYNQEYSSAKGQHQGVIKTLKDDYSGDLIIETEQLDTKRNKLDSDVGLLYPPAKPYQRYYYILASFYILLALLLISVVSFLSVLTRKNRLIEQRSIDLKQQMDITRRTKEGLDEARRLAKQGSWEWDLHTLEFHRSDELAHLLKSCTDIDGNNLEKFRHTLNDEVHQEFQTTVDQLRDTGSCA